MRFVVIGITDHPQPFFPPEVLEIIQRGKVFSGGRRHHEIVAPLLPKNAQWIDITVPLEAVFEQYRSITLPQEGDGGRLIVFVSGDPLFFGFANTIRRLMPEADIQLYPAFNSLQMLAHRLLMPYHDMRVVSLTGRPWPALDRALIERATKIGVLTDREHTPATIAQRMLDYGYDGYMMHIGEHLGNPQKESIATLPLTEAATRHFSTPNCLILTAPTQSCSAPTPPPVPTRLCSAPPPVLSRLCSAPPPVLSRLCSAPPPVPTQPCSVPPPVLSRLCSDVVAAPVSSSTAPTVAPPLPSPFFGLPDSSFALLDGREKMITKMPIRLLTLQRLDLPRRRVLWDIGACTGSVSIEARLLFPHLHVVAFEVRSECEAIIRENCRHHHAPGIELLIGDFCQLCCDALAAPDAVFIGGHGGHLQEIMAKALRYLTPGGVIVMNSVVAPRVTTDSRQLWDEACRQLGLQQEKPLHIQLDNHHPITILKCRKP